MSDGFAYSGTGGPIGKRWSVVIAALFAVIGVVCLVSRGWPYLVAFLALALLTLAQGWVIEPAFQSLGRRIRRRRQS